MRRLVLCLTLLGCSEPAKIVLSRGTTPPRFLRGASLAEVVGYYGRTDTSGTVEGTAVLMDFAYLRAFAYQQGHARFDDDETIEAEVQRSLERYGGERTSFALRFSMRTDLAYRSGDPLLDLRTWSFRLRDGRRRVVRSEDVESLSPQGRTQVESVPTWGGAIAYTRHSYRLQGVVRFAYRMDHEVGWVSLHAFPPGVEEEEPLVFVWLLR